MDEVKEIDNNPSAETIWDNKAEQELQAEREAKELEALEAAAQREEEERQKAEQTASSIKEALKERAKEEDSTSPNLSLKKIIGGDFLTAELVRSQLWLIVIIVFFIIIYIANRYSCQQDLIEIDKLQTVLKDAKYRALTSSSQLTEKCRESKVLEMLANNKDSVLHIASQPPFIVELPDE